MNFPDVGVVPTPRCRRLVIPCLHIEQIHGRFALKNTEALEMARYGAFAEIIGGVTMEEKSVDYAIRLACAFGLALPLLRAVRVAPESLL